MCARHVDPAELDLQELAFLARYRFPRHLALQVERALVELSPAAAWRAAGACSLALLRFVAAVGRARWCARQGERPSLPVSVDALGKGLDDGHFISELAGRRAACRELISLAKAATGGATGAPEASSLKPLRERMLRALAPLISIASYRLLVPSPGSTGHGLEPSATVTVLLGVGLRHSLDLPDGLRLPPNTPALLDPRSGRILSLAPLLRWEPDQGPAGGSIFELREVEEGDGIFLEVGEAAGRRLRLPLSGRPSEADLAGHEALLHAASQPPALLADDHILHDSHKVLGIIQRGDGTELHLATRFADRETAVLLSAQAHAQEPRRPGPGTGPGREQEPQTWPGDAMAEPWLQVPHSPGLMEPRPLGRQPWGSLLEMDFPSGASLAEQLAYKGVLDPFECLALLEPLCDALGTLHQAGLAHLRLRPKDLLLDADGRLLITPHPLAAAWGPRPGAMTGAQWVSHPLLPPELRARPPAGARGHAGSDPGAGQAADIWLLGALLGELLLGERIGTPSAVPPPPRLPAPLGELIRHLLEPRPEDRCPSAAAVAAALRGAVSQLTPQRHIALDLEGTLITSSRDPLPRSHLGEFASWCLDTFHRIFVFTAVDERNARVVMARLVRAGVLPPRFSELLELVRWPRGRGGVLKDLRLLRVPLHWVVLLDDMSAWIPEDQRHRWVPIISFAEPRSGDQ